MGAATRAAAVTVAADIAKTDPRMEGVRLLASRTPRACYEHF
jgi:hypothetical protein